MRFAYAGEASSSKRCPSIKVNGRSLKFADAAGKYVRVERTWADGDRVELKLPMNVRVRRWTENRGTASVERGPLTYSLKIRQTAVRAGGTDRWPAWDLFPDSPWNYGLELNRAGTGGSFRVVRGAWPADDQPWAESAQPIALRAKARRIRDWARGEHGLVREVEPSPVRSEEPAEDVTLVPMGAARLRISAFPVIGRGPDAKDWRAAP